MYFSGIFQTIWVYSVCVMSLYMELTYLSGSCLCTVFCVGGYTQKCSLSYETHFLNYLLIKSEWPSSSSWDWAPVCMLSYGFWHWTVKINKPQGEDKKKQGACLLLPSLVSSVSYRVINRDVKVLVIFKFLNMSQAGLMIQFHTHPAEWL